MSYSLTAQERAFQVSICDDEKELCITSSSPSYTRKLRKIAEAMGIPIKDLCSIDGVVHTIRVYLPKKCLTLRVPRVMSDAQKTALQNAREAQKTAVGAAM